MPTMLSRIFPGLLRMKNLILILFLLPACVTQPLSVDTLYRKDLLVKVDGANFYGTAVQPKKPSYEMNVYFYKKPTKFVLSSCHRQIVWANPGNGVKFTYKPEPDIEQSEYCPLEMGSFDDKGQDSWAIIDFRSGFETLEATLTCNGEGAVKSQGVSLCQSKTKLVQKISFPEPVKHGVSADCPAPESKDGMNFLIEMGRGKCLYLFKRGKDLHRLITFGYDDVILRG